MFTQEDTNFIESFFQNGDTDKLRNMSQEIAKLLARQYKDQISGTLSRMLQEYQAQIQQGQNIETEWLLINLLIDCMTTAYRPKDGVTGVGLPSDFITGFYEMAVKGGLSNMAPEQFGADQVEREELLSKLR